MKLLPMVLLLAATALADTTPPQLVSSVPSQGQASVLPTTTLQLVFSKPMDPASVNTSTAVRIINLTTGYSTGYMFGALSADGLTVSFYPSSTSLQLNVAYCLAINPGVLKDRSGNLLVTPPPIYFNTFPHPDKTEVKLIGTVPANLETGVAINSAMYVVFDRPIARISYDAGISVTTPTSPVKFTSSMVSDSVLQIQPALLLPSNKQIQVSVAGIVGANGAVLPDPVTFTFQTGLLPDTTVQSLKFIPPAGTALPLPLHVSFTKPVDAPLMSTGTVSFQSYYNYFRGDSYAGVFTVSDDRQSLTISSLSRLAPGRYNVTVTVPFDRTGGKLNPFAFQVVLGTGTDPSPSQLLAASPPDGTPDAPPSAPLRFVYSRPIDLAGPGAIALTTNGAPVDRDVSVDNTGAIITLKPRTSLKPKATYTISVAGFSDFAGNLVAPYSATFTTGSGAYPGAFQVLSVDPPTGAAGVDPLASVTVTFSRPVDPVSLYNGYGFYLMINGGSVPVDCAAVGAVVTLHPRYPLNGMVNLNVAGVTDIGGASLSLNFSSYFSVATAPDATQPVVTAVSPGDGGTVLYSSGYVELTFSKPMAIGTFNQYIPGSFQVPSNFAAFTSGVATIPLTVVGISNTRVALEFQAPSDSTITLTAGSGITDVLGNSLVPFRTTVHTSAAPRNGAAHLVKQIPYAGSGGRSAADQSFATYWSAPLDRASVEQNLFVYTSDGPVAGQFLWSADSRAFVFTPAATLRAGLTVYVGLAGVTHDAAGLAISLSTTYSLVYPATDSASTKLSIVGDNFTSRIPLNAVIDLAFNQDLPDGLLQTAKFTLNGVNCPFVRVRPRVLRCTPSALFVANKPYTLLFDSGTGLTWNSIFTPADVMASAHPSFLAGGPVASDVPQNSLVSILFSEPVSRLAMPGGVKLLANGVEVPTQASWTGDQSLQLQPPPLLAPSTTYTVVVSGFENVAGIPLPDRTWTFHTGGGIDTSSPSVVRVQPSGSNVGTDAVPSVTFDSPIAPDSLRSQLQLMRARASDGTSIASVPVTLGFSDDLKTVYLRSGAPLPAGSPMNVIVNPVANLVGNSTSGWGNTYSFQVGYGAAASSAITGTSPPPDSTGVPINATIQVQSSGNLSLLGGIAVTVAENGSPLPATWQVAAGGLTLAVVPSRPLGTNSQIDVTVAGIADTPYHFAFSTGDGVDFISPSASAFPSGDSYPVPPGIAVHIRFNEVLNPLSVNAANVYLRASDNALVDATVSLDSAGRMITLAPNRPLIEGLRYTASWTALDLAGNQSTGSATFLVLATDLTPAAALVGIDPADGSIGVRTTVQPQAFFNRLVEFTLGADSFRLLLDGVPVPGTLTVTGSKLSFVPKSALQPGASYRLELRGAVDAYGNSVPDAASTFTVASPGDPITALRLVSSVPASQAVGVAADAPVRLSFNQPVTLASALGLTVSQNTSQAYSAAYPAIHVEGNDIVLQPLSPFTGGARIGISGNVTSVSGSSTYVNIWFNAAPLSDTAPPTVEYVFPALGSTIPVNGTSIILRFSKPVILGPNSIRVIGASCCAQGAYLSQDGRTAVLTPDLVPDADITVGVGADITDFAGNAMVPFSYSLHSLSTSESKQPLIASITPPVGATNVPADTPIQLQFTHAMDPASVSTGLHVTADGVPLGGSAAAAADPHNFQFKPDIPFPQGSFVAIQAGPPVQDVAGQLLDPFYSSFTVVKNPAVTDLQVVGLYATAVAIDVRFNAPLSRVALAPYLRLGFLRVPSHWEVRGPDWLRIVPDEPLVSGYPYRLVLDDRTELPVGSTEVAEVAPAIESSGYDGSAVHLRFSGEINPLTVSLDTVRLTRPDGTEVPYYLYTGLDRRELLLRPATSEPELSLEIVGVESPRGKPMRDCRIRLKAARSSVPARNYN